MDKQSQNINKPNYKKIYHDMISKKFPHKETACKSILEKENFTALDILQINILLFDTQKKETEIFNQNHRSYDAESINSILEYQKKNNLNNSQLAYKFKISRNSIIKWKKIYNY